MASKDGRNRMKHEAERRLKGIARREIKREIRSEARRAVRSLKDRHRSMKHLRNTLDGDTTEMTIWHHTRL